MSGAKENQIGPTISCPFCGNINITYNVSSGVYKAGNRKFTKYFHHYKCSCGASISGRDQFDALRKWNTRIAPQDIMEGVETQPLTAAAQNTAVDG